MKNRGKSIALVAAGVMLGSAISGPAATAAEMLAAQRSTAPFFLNGAPVQVDAYLINNNHYFKLRDIAALVDFGVTWNAESGTVSIDTMTGYDGAYKAPSATDTQTWEAATTPPAYREQANAAVFDSVYTAEAYDALRECIVNGGDSAPISMSADTRAAMQGAIAAVGSYPSYDLKSGKDGTAFFSTKYSGSYEDAAEICRRFLATLNGKSEREKLNAIACYVCERLDYDADSTTTPRTLFADSSTKKGNCMSFAHGFQFLCDLADIPCILVHSDIHQWNEVYTGGRWYCVDLTSFDIHYNEGSLWRLLADTSELQGSIYEQSNPRLTRFAKELLVPGSAG